MSNITNDRISTTMTPAQITAVKNAFATIQTNMPFLLGLTKAERTTIPKIGVDNKIFAEDTITASVNNSELLPDYINVANMQADLLLFNQLEQIMLLTRQLYEKLEDTQIQAGSEVFIASLNAYKAFRTAASAGIPGTDSIYSQLKPHFNKKKTKKTANKKGPK